uniref:Uncharacterized protein n=1 Tax=Setaria viridis TaxID=4556 RepID=A0A4U6TL24_SETVI|nr:hypothetical protein SEVIR_8G209400v2 [Setaria viridis]TKW01914.1 hypothetical protein SEVIR_8G209400v2 [Setaria viridis]
MDGGIGEERRRTASRCDESPARPVGGAKMMSHLRADGRMGRFCGSSLEKSGRNGSAATSSPIQAPQFGAFSPAHKSAAAQSPRRCRTCPRARPPQRRRCRPRPRRRARSSCQCRLFPRPRHRARRAFASSSLTVGARAAPEEVEPPGLGLLLIAPPKRLRGCAAVVPWLLPLATVPY